MTTERARPASRAAESSAALETLSLWHAALFIIAASWGFGGNIHWIRPPLTVWGAGAALLTLAGLVQRVRERPRDVRPLLWLLPWIGLATLVLIGAANPNTTVATFFESTIYRPLEPAIRWLPSSARPDLARSELALLSGAYLTGFNLLLLVRRRRLLHRLLLVVVINATVLAVFGTVQKLAAAPGLYFGLQRSPNPTFFASFIYHNHWGPFALLALATSLGLAARGRGAAAKRGAPRRWPLLLAAALLLAATIPLSGSRSCMLLLLGLLAMAGLRTWLEWRAEARRFGHWPRGRVAVFAVAGIAAGAAILWLSAPVWQARLTKTREQLADWRQVGGLGGREILYHDTWRMARDRLWTGWGLESFETVFVRYNTATSPRDRLQVHFDQAHSDWLQSVAETGLVGTVLLLLMAVVPLAAYARHRPWRDPLAAALLLGVALLVLYAAVEFPFANPAVALTFWILFFAALRHARLSDV